MSRRKLLLLGLGASGLAASTVARAQSKSVANKKHSYTSGQKFCLGTASVAWPDDRTGPRPSAVNLKRAREFLASFDGLESPYHVASRVAASKSAGESGELFRRRWASESNPAIPWYFSFTDEAPCNDAQLDWCAAFASWALMCSGRQCLKYADVRGSIAALAKHGSSDKSKAKRGDLILLSRARGGHVGFLSHWDGDDGVYLMGGNQREDGGVAHSSVSESRIPIGETGARKFEFFVPIDFFKPVGRQALLPEVRDGVGHLAPDLERGRWPTHD